MRFFPDLRLLLAIRLPTTANSNGKHGGPRRAHSPSCTTSKAIGGFPRDFHGKFKRIFDTRAACSHQDPFITTFRSELTP